MNPFRVLADWISQPEPTPDSERPGDWPAPTPFRPNLRLIGYLEEGQHPALTDRERLMRHTGRPECPIPEHGDALRELGRMILDRDQWRHRALTAESRLRHPARHDNGDDLDEAA